MGELSKPPGLFGPLVATAAGLALAGDQLRLGWLARHAEVAHLLNAPPLWIWIPLTAAMALAGGVGLWASQVRRDVKLARVPLLAAIVVAFVEFFVTPAVRPVDARFDAEMPAEAFAALVRSYAEQSGALPTTFDELAAVLASGLPTDLPPPPFLSQGKPIDRWSLVMRSSCTGPDERAVGLAPGSLIYCLRSDGRRAWITATGRVSTTFGATEVLALDGKPVVGVVDAPSPTEPAGPSAPDGGAPGGDR